MDEHGKYTLTAGEELNGKYVLKEGTEKVLDILKEHVIHEEDYVHSYPYDWRTNEPVILRASQQWFIDTEKLKENAIASISLLYYLLCLYYRFCRMLWKMLIYFLRVIKKCTKIF